MAAARVSFSTWGGPPWKFRCLLNAGLTTLVGVSTKASLRKPENTLLPSICCLAGTSGLRPAVLPQKPGFSLGFRALPVGSLHALPPVPSRVLAWVPVEPIPMPEVPETTDLVATTFFSSESLQRIKLIPGLPSLKGQTDLGDHP